MAVKTFTFGASQIYVSRDLQEHVINTGQLFVMTIVQDAVDTDAAYFTGTTTTPALTLVDGGTIEVEGDTVLTYFHGVSDASADLNAGSIWVRDIDGSRQELKVISLTLDDADAPTTSVMILELAENPIIQFTWTTTVA